MCLTGSEGSAYLYEHVDLSFSTLFGVEAGFYFDLFFSESLRHDQRANLKICLTKYQIFLPTFIRFDLAGRHGNLDLLPLAHERRLERDFYAGLIVGGKTELFHLIPVSSLNANDWRYAAIQSSLNPDMLSQAERRFGPIERRPEHVGMETPPVRDVEMTPLT